MKDYSEHAGTSIRYGLSGLILYIGPLLYWIFIRREADDYDSSELGYLIVAIIGGPLLLLYGLLLLPLEKLKSGIAE